MKFVNWLGIFVMVFSLSGCFSKSNSWNQKLTVEVETPNGVVSALV